MGYVATKSRPRYLDTDLKAEFAGDNPDYFDVKTNKWYSTSSGSELVTNGTFTSGTTGWTALDATIGLSNGCMTVTNTASYGRAYTTINCVAGTKYKILIQGNGDADSNAVIELNSTVPLSGQYNGDIYSISYASLSNFNKYTAEFVSTKTGTVYLSISPSGPGTAGYNIVDNISVFKSDLTIGSEITPRNYMNNIVYADHNGQPEYVEEVAKVEYKDSMKLNKLSVTEGFDLGQTWQNMTSKRVTGVTYTNTTGKPIQIYTVVDSGSANTVTNATLVINGVSFQSSNTNGSLANARAYTYAIIPHNNTYVFTPTSGSMTTWYELR